jgi:hypothetical protein
MTQSIAARMRKNRELKVTIGKFTFTCRRPTDVEAAAIYRNNESYAEVTRQFVIGWDNVTEDDLVGGGTQTLVPFERDAWNEWCPDHPEFWPVIANAILDAYKLHRDREDEARKNSEPGSKESAPA